MIEVDRGCDAIARLFLRKSVKLQNPTSMRSENPVYRRSGDSFDLKSVREYQPFDDLRKIDWKLYGRTDRYYIKEFYEEENDRLYFLIDASASMRVYDTEVYATFIASLAYILLKLRFHLDLVSFSSKVEAMALNIKEPKNIHRVIGFLRGLEFDGTTRIRPVLQFLREMYRPATVFLFSDFFDSRFRPTRIFKRLFLLHFFRSFSELSPQSGDIEVEDRESGAKILVPYSAALGSELEKRESRFFGMLRRELRGVHYHRVGSRDDRSKLYWELLEELYG